MNIFQYILQALQARLRLYLLTVIESTGSAPGRRGFMMVVTEGEQFYGSIGGGMMEYNLVETAKALLLSQQVETFWVKQVHRGEVQDSSGMICSGQQTIAFTPLSDEDIVSIKACIDAPMIQISEHGIIPLVHKQVETCEMYSAQSWIYTQLNNQAISIHLFGAGHVSVPTSELLGKLGFRVKLYDNRSGINTFVDNHWVYSKEIIDYACIVDCVSVNVHDYVLIMTHKFVEDKLLVKQILGLNVAFVGVLGSQNKINVMFAALRKEGHTETDLAKVSAPIGLNICSQTTTEIAVSIAAELIQVRNSQNLPSQ